MLQLLIVVGVISVAEGPVEVICSLHLRACGLSLLFKLILCLVNFRGTTDSVSVFLLENNAVVPPFSDLYAFAANLVGV